MIVEKGLKAGEPPIVCRTPGRAEQDSVGTCGRFTAMAWGKGRGHDFLVAMEGKEGRVHIFDPKVYSNEFPRRACILLSVEVAGRGLSQALSVSSSSSSSSSGGDVGGVVAVGRGQVLSSFKWPI